MNKKPKKTMLNGVDERLAELLLTMVVQSWELRQDNRGKTHLYIRCAPETKNTKLNIA